MGLKLGVLCYIKKEGKTLMLYRNRKPNDVHEGKWNGLGGKLEKGESPEEALLREVKEEADVSLIDFTLKGIITFPDFADGEDWYVYLYTSNSFTGEINYDCPEGELHWVKDEKIPSLNLWDGDYLFLKWLEQEKFFSAKMIYQGEKLVSHQVYFYPF